jgi:hypothetical protein
MSGADEARAWRSEVERVRAAVERLAMRSRAVAGAALSEGVGETAIDIVANADDDVLDEIVTDYRFDAFAVLQSLKFMAGAFLTLRQARRLAEMIEEVKTATGLRYRRVRAAPERRRRRNKEAPRP